MELDLTTSDNDHPPILAHKHFRSASIFTPDSLLREARRQKRAPLLPVPKVCLLAEELFACGCELLISITSAGQITPAQQPPYFILIDRALRDEGTSYHYLPPSEWSEASTELVARLGAAFDDAHVPVLRGPTWTTDAPFRETAQAIEAMKERGILAVEMEAAALYAFAKARERPVICFAHVTNQMGQIDGDFEKGAANGATDALLWRPASPVDFGQADRQPSRKGS